jgi:hypothetical protein
MGSGSGPRAPDISMCPGEVLASFVRVIEDGSRAPISADRLISARERCSHVLSIMVGPEDAKGGGE